MAYSCVSVLSDVFCVDIYLSRWLTVVSACFLMGSVQLGVQTLPYLYSGELFPSDIRAICKVRELD